MSQSVATRGILKTCQIFGKPEELCRSKLPTIAECLRYFLFVQHNLVQQRMNKNCINSEALSILANALEEIWKRASIPIVSRARILFLIKQYLDRRLALLKSIKRDAQKQSFQTVVSDFQDSTKSLFDIASCKCTDYLKCRCEKNLKIPPVERDFMRDQRSYRKMKIGGVDKQYCHKIERRRLKQARKCVETLESINPTPGGSHHHEKEMDESPEQTPQIQNSNHSSDASDFADTDDTDKKSETSCSFKLYLLC